LFLRHVIGSFRRGARTVISCARADSLNVSTTQVYKGACRLCHGGRIAEFEDFIGYPGFTEWAKKYGLA